MSLPVFYPQHNRLHQRIPAQLQTINYLLGFYPHITPGKQLPDSLRQGPIHRLRNTSSGSGT